MKPLHYIILDDSFEDRFFLNRALRKVSPGAIVTEFVYCEEAFVYLKSLQGDAPALVFVDINMPRMNGFEFIELCHDQIYSGGTPAVRFVMITNSIDPADIERAMLDSRIGLCLQKPVLPDALEKIAGCSPAVAMA